MVARKTKYPAVYPPKFPQGTSEDKLREISREAARLWFGDGYHHIRAGQEVLRFLEDFEFSRAILRTWKMTNQIQRWNWPKLCRKRSIVQKSEGKRCRILRYRYRYWNCNCNWNCNCPNLRPLYTFVTTQFQSLEDSQSVKAFSWLFKIGWKTVMKL
jgi:hypothetical protein